jgi:hypothetical protein
VREANRLLNTIENTGFLIILGLGGAFHIMSALEREDIQKIIIIDFNIHGIAELLASKEYVDIFKDKRVSLIIDPPLFFIEEYILNNYIPALYGGISILPLRTRTDMDAEKFNTVCDEIKKSVDRVSNDFSVQSTFGKRWFSNIIKNLQCAEKQKSFFPPIQHAALIAAGPSLNMQLPQLRKERSSLFVISTDTAFPVLASSGIIPDAIISIDCQHYSSYHFIGNYPKNIPLFLDMASPALIPQLSHNSHFFTSGHPLSQYISQYWKQFPFIDTSGGNVTYAALSLADLLGAKQIDLYGADFSYPHGNTYAQGTYIHNIFGNKQNRLLPMESEFNHFLFRNTSLQKITNDRTFYYETRMLKNYREHFERKAATLSSNIIQIEGFGASLNVQRKNVKQRKNIIDTFSAGIPSMSAEKFLEQYYGDIKKLLPSNNASLFLTDRKNSLSKEYHLMLTLIPLAAFFKKENPKEDINKIFEMTKVFALDKIEKSLNYF